MFETQMYKEQYIFVLSVVDGDDLTSYDFEEKLVERDAEDEKSWSQLEWELASQDGRVTGRTSYVNWLVSVFSRLSNLIWSALIV